MDSHRPFPAAHDHHAHPHAPGDFGRAFAVGTALNVAYIVAEVVLGVAAHSLSLLADAGHNLSDVLGLLMAWGAATLSTQRPTLRHTYGYRRSSILAALFNGLFLLVALGGVTWEALRRFGQPAEVNGGTVIAVAAAGIAVNGVTALLFMAGRKGDLNVRAAFVHMVGDATVSAGVVLAGVAIAFTGWWWLDPAVSLVIVAIIFLGTWGLLRSAIDLSMDAVPEGIDSAKVRACLHQLPGVRDVHDLHIWPMSTTETALTAHLVVPNYSGDEALIRGAIHALEAFGIEHVTLQVERGEHSCHLAPDEVV
ncbi:MAG: cation transporter [Verrucomicrobia bacterium]|nr:cation transporter [Verrucomicrobiota bacterium]